MKKRILSAVIAVCMMISIAGCSEQEMGEENVSQAQTSDIVESQPDESVSDTTTTTTTSATEAETQRQTSNDGEYKSVDFEQVFNSCVTCTKLLEKRYEYEKTLDEFYKNIDTYDMNKVYKLFYEAMQETDHSCSAKSEYVKNYPYYIGISRGLYTGYWKGCGPDGEGKFVGTDASAGSITFSFTYEGNWKNGLPDGIGDHTVNLIQKMSNDVYASWSVRYKGEMKCGFRYGNGTAYVVLDVLNSNKVSTGAKAYIYFDAARFVMNKMQGTTDYYKYINDQLIETGKASSNSSLDIDNYIDFPVIPAMTPEYTISYEDETQPAQTEQVTQDTQRQTVTQRTTTTQKPAVTTRKAASGYNRNVVSKKSSQGKELLKKGAAALGLAGVAFFGIKALSNSIKNDNAKLEQWMKDSAEQSRKNIDYSLQKDKEAKEKAQKDREAYEKRQKANYNWGMYKEGLAQGKDKNSKDMREYYNNGRIPA